MEHVTGIIFKTSILFKKCFSLNNKYLVFLLFSFKYMFKKNLAKPMLIKLWLTVVVNFITFLTIPFPANFVVLNSPCCLTLKKGQQNISNAS